MFPSIWALVVPCLLAFPTYLAFRLYHANRLRSQMPPGPPGLPILGNVLQLRHFQWLKYAEWTEKYGPIFSLNLLGQPVVVVSDFSTAADLVERRSTIYSSRPWFVMSCEILTGGLFFGLLPYGEKWRRMRRAAHDSFVGRAVSTYEARQEREAAVLLTSLLQDPGGWDDHLMRSAASAVLSSVFGRPPLPRTRDSDALVTRINDITHRLGGAIPSIPGAFLVEVFPMLRHLSPWKRAGHEWFLKDTALLEQFMSEAEEKTRAGRLDSSCFAARLLDGESKYGLERTEAAWVAGAMIAAGTEPIAAAFVTFMLAMTLYPDVQHCAQAELDAVVGRDRLPRFSDRERLPYVEAVVKEVMRWRPIDPLGVPRASTRDDWYKSYFIPKGTVLIYNIWSMNRDPSHFSDYDEFRPERYLDSDGQLLSSPIPDTHGQGHFSFGSGRRVCPGKDFANQGFFITFASLLWAFDIKAPLNPKGAPIIPSRTACIDQGIVVRPAPFECTIAPRFPAVETILSGPEGA